MSNYLVDFTNDQIIHAVASLLSPATDKRSHVLARSDIAPKVYKDTGVWVEMDPEGDRDSIGFGFIVYDAMDADTKMPFVTAIKVHKPSFKMNPLKYTNGILKVLNQGLSSMQDEMVVTERDIRRQKLDFML